MLRRLASTPASAVEFDSRTLQELIDMGLVERVGSACHLTIRGQIAAARQPAGLLERFGFSFG
ncbi:MAG: hypothetical protein RLZ98_810 [Pseudomonadota bacterium]